MNYITWFNQIGPADQELVGGKNCALGSMIKDLTKQGIPIPHGFAITSQAYWYYLSSNKLLTRMKKIMRELKDYTRVKQVQKVGHEIRALILSGEFPPDLAQEIIDAYHTLSEEYGVQRCDVAVRSSATAEDLPTASFAGQQETFLNVKGDTSLLDACKRSMASLFTDRAIVYRKEHRFDHFKVALSVGVQKMVRADKGSSGVAFSLDPESGFKNVIMIDSAWGLGESIVKGLVTPDQFCVFKPTLDTDAYPILQKTLGSKKIKIVYAAGSKGTKKVKVSDKDQAKFSLSDADVIELARMVQIIDQYYSNKNGSWTPMDVEWARDGNSGKLYIVQARPETVHGRAETHGYSLYTLKKKATPLIEGQAIGRQIVSGTARVVKGVGALRAIKRGEIIVTSMTDPDWVPVMKQAAGIVTDLGGRTCHAAIVSRELGLPAVVGCAGATKKIRNGQKITIDCSQGSQGFVYAGNIPFTKREITLDRIPKLTTDIMVNIAQPDGAFSASLLPVDGVGLARLEFIIANEIGVHPMAALDLSRVKDARIKKRIKERMRGYRSGAKFFVDKLSSGIAMIAAAFYPRPVIVRLSDFKSNEYRDLLGGSFFEPEEANPMLGFRGASRYVHELYEQAFALECAAIQAVRKTYALDNVKVMVPFVRTVAEAKRVVHVLAQHGLAREQTEWHPLLPKNKGLELVMMCEIPSNVILIDQFAQLFDGFSIGSNDLTQFVLGIDRDSALLQDAFDENNEAVRRFIAQAIAGAHKAGRFIGICGQGPSDSSEFAQFLLKHAIDSISLNPDAVLPFFLALND